MAIRHPWGLSQFQCQGRSLRDWDCLINIHKGKGHQTPLKAQPVSMSRTLFARLGLPHQYSWRQRPYSGFKSRGEPRFIKQGPLGRSNIYQCGSQGQRGNTHPCMQCFSLKGIVRVCCLRDFQLQSCFKRWWSLKDPVSYYLKQIHQICFE